MNKIDEDILKGRLRALKITEISPNTYFRRMIASDEFKEMVNGKEYKRLYAYTKAFFGDVSPYGVRHLTTLLLGIGIPLDEILKDFDYLPDDFLQDSDYLEEIDLPDNIKGIGKRCFRFSNVRRINLSKDTKEFSSFCFSMCTKLEKINYPGTTGEFVKYLKLGQNLVSNTSTKIVRCSDGDFYLD